MIALVFQSDCLPISQIYLTLIKLPVSLRWQA